MMSKTDDFTKYADVDTTPRCLLRSRTDVKNR